jgi:hypothetical protein
MNYYYGMRLRGFSIGTFPKDGFVDVMRNNVYKGREYHDVLKYDRKLTEEELREWEFDFLENYEEKQ